MVLVTTMGLITAYIVAILFIPSLFSILTAKYPDDDLNNKSGMRN